MIRHTLPPGGGDPAAIHALMLTISAELARTHHLAFRDGVWMKIDGGCGPGPSPSRPAHDHELRAAIEATFEFSHSEHFAPHLNVRLPNDTLRAVLTGGA